jgi:hypothetical protein
VTVCVAAWLKVPVTVPTPDLVTLADDEGEVEVETLAVGVAVGGSDAETVCADPDDVADAELVGALPDADAVTADADDEPDAVAVPMDTVGVGPAEFEAVTLVLRVPADTVMVALTGWWVSERTSRLTVAAMDKLWERDAVAVQRDAVGDSASSADLVGGSVAEAVGGGDAVELHVRVAVATIESVTVRAADGVGTCDGVGSAVSVLLARTVSDTVSCTVLVEVRDVVGGSERVGVSTTNVRDSVGTGVTVADTVSVLERVGTGAADAVGGIAVVVA